MKILFRKKVLSNTKISDELKIAFGLFAIVLLVLLGYLSPGFSAFFAAQAALPFIVLIVLVILALGVVIVLQIVEPVIKISKEAHRIAEGDLTREIELAREDEVGELGTALNQMTRKIRDNVEELQRLSKTTENLNDEINNRILVLSNLMEISNMIAQNASLDDVLAISTKQFLSMKGMSLGCVILKDRLSGEFCIRHLGGDKSEPLISQGIEKMKVQLGQGLLGKTILMQRAVVINRSTEVTREIDDFLKQFLVKHAIVAPVSSKGNAYGLFIVGGDDDAFQSTDTQKELLQLVAKHIAIGVLNDLLKREIEKMEATDGLTGLYNNIYARNKLSLEVKQAVKHQHTCSFVLLRIAHFEEYYDTFGHIKAEDALIKIAGIIKSKLEEEDRAARFAENEFALILPGSSKKEAITIAQEIINEVAAIFVPEDPGQKRLACTAAVVANPIDGDTADELILKSGVILTDTLEQGGGRVGSQV